MSVWQPETVGGKNLDTSCTGSGGGAGVAPEEGPHSYRHTA